MVVSNCRGRGEVLVTSHLRVDFPLHICDYNDVRGGGCCRHSSYGDGRMSGRFEGMGGWGRR